MYHAWFITVPSQVMSTRMESALERHKLIGYMCAGGVCVLAGIALLVAAEVTYKPVVVFEDIIAAAREAFKRDRKRDILFNVGIALLTDGVLLLFGFGLTAVVSDSLLEHQLTL